MDITEEEQRHLKTIIDASEKRRRNTNYQKEKRRSKGVVKREDYIKRMHDKTDDNLLKVQDLLNKGLKQKEIAEILGVSRSWVSRLAKELKAK